MAIIRNCPFGIISGSIGTLTFLNRKGQQIVYLKPPAEKMTRKTPKAKNVRLMMSILAEMYYKKLSPLLEIKNYWNVKGKTVIGFNMFMKSNLPYLYHSIQRGKRKCSKENWIDLSKTQLTDGGKLHEPCRIKKLSYEKQKITVNWETTIWNGNGKPEDTAHIIIIYCKPTNTKKKFLLKTFYGTTTRGQGEITMEIKGKLIQKYITALIFFTNDSSYSETIGSNLASE